MTASAATSWVEHLLRAGLVALHRGGGMLIEHRELPDAACGAMLDHFGLRYSADERARMRAAGRFDAKHPGVPYADDSAAKRAHASEDVGRIAVPLAPLYAELDAVRRATAAAPVTALTRAPRPRTRQGNRI